VAVFLANVGVNSAHAARSPLFADGTFELLPIPEKYAWRPPMLRLGDVAHKCTYAPPSWRTRAVHLDPDLSSAQPTYGDNCRRAGRAFSLRRAQPGDLIAFVARLQPQDRPAAFHLVGCLEIADVLEDVTREPGPGWWDGNAHIRRARAGGVWDEFWVFKGGAASRLFRHAVAFGASEAESAYGKPLHRLSHRTELQTIASHSRAVRRIEGAAEQWLRSICPS
jgi:hypothetical protein